MSPTNICVVCGAGGVRHFCRIERLLYWRCDTCMATWIDPSNRLEAKEELAQYLLHRNVPGDAGYRAFLERIARPLLDKLDTPSIGLDYGCGPGPVLAEILREAGHEMALYDPFFAANPDVLERTYNFITCTETAEHFFNPAEEFEKLDRLLRPGGWLGLMTCFQTDDALFADWHYRRDPTHVVFYAEETMRHLAARFGWRCEIPAKDVVLMQKPPPSKTHDPRVCP